MLLNRLARTILTVALLLFTKGALCADKLEELNKEIDSWHLKEARNIATNLDEATQKTPFYKYLSGKLLFHEGDFESALKNLREAVEGAKVALDWKMQRDLCLQAEEVFRSYIKVKGQSGRFVYRYQEGNDAVLVSYAEKTLVRQLEALSKALNDRPDFTIEVDILPDIKSLAAASGLSIDQIERTGTVGVTKYARIMIISPQALAAGYPWLTTLAHELTHFIITRTSRNNTPVWLHEGIAKLYERMWMNGDLGSLTPEEAYLLDRAAEERRLIPLRQFHPSVANLPSQEDAALAYAQVLSFTKYMSAKLGPDWTYRLLANLSEGASVENAFVRLFKFDLKRLYSWWQQSMIGKRLTPIPAVSLMKKRYIRGEAAGEKGLDALLDVDIKRHLRVGDLLRLRGHTDAAIQEYREAEQLTEFPSTKIIDRLCALLLEVGKADEALSMLPQIAELYPAHATVFVQLGRAYAMKKDFAAAQDAYEKANAINPFDPFIHCAMKILYGQSGHKEQFALESANCSKLSSERPK